MPGTDINEAVAVIAGELDVHPHLPELPARGPGADLIGRTGALLCAIAGDFGLETTPTGWRRNGGNTREMRRARSWLDEDLDRVEEVFGDSEGLFKIQMCGPWTWAAGVESGSGQPSIRDEGFVADMTHAWHEAAAVHLFEVARRLPGRELDLQVDEPSLPKVLAGAITTASGMGRLAAVSAPAAAAALGQATRGLTARTSLHCCDTFPFAVARAAGFAAISLDTTPHRGLRAKDCEELAETVEAGVGLVLGVVPTQQNSQVSVLWDHVQEMWRRTGLAESLLVDVDFSPACGLAGLPPGVDRQRLAAATELAQRASN